jgi:Ca2+-binding RTX toxin-like protein
MDSRDWNQFNQSNRDAMSGLINGYGVFTSGVEFIDGGIRNGSIRYPSSSWMPSGVTFHDTVRGLSLVAKPVAVFDVSYDLGTYTGPSKTTRAVGIAADFGTGALVSAGAAGAVVGLTALGLMTPPGWVAGAVAFGAGAVYTFGFSDPVRNGVTAALDNDFYQSSPYLTGQGGQVSTRQPGTYYNVNFVYSGRPDIEPEAPWTGWNTPRERLAPEAFTGKGSSVTAATHRVSEIASMNNLRDYNASQAAASRPRPASEGAQQAQRDAAISRPRSPSEGAQQAQNDARNKASQPSYSKPGWGLDSPSERRGTSGGSSGGVQSSNTKSSSIGGSNSGGSKTSSSGRTSGGLSPTERDERNRNSGGTSGSGNKDSKSTNASKASSGSSSKPSSGGGSKPSGGYNSSGSKGKNGMNGRNPVFLDLNGNGLTITDTSTSNLFLDIGGDGYKYRTAWVGAGDGVLMIDVDGDGKISDRKEVVFTDWDPSSETDMQALRQVFDTNGNGLLDAGDARWSQFKVMVTNADGTITQRTLAELGIQSFNLAVDETKIAFDGGSTIDGQTTFTRTNGTTGLAATVTVAVDTNGYVVTETQSTDASGNRTIVNRAVDRDGQLVSETTRITSANGLSITSRFDDDGDGVVDRVLTDVTVTNSNGSRTQTETMRDGGEILTWSKTTQTSADGRTITIDRDERGGGYPTERETRVTAANNSLTITISQLAQNGSVISQVSNVLSADRLTRTVNIDADGNASFERRTEHQTIRNADGSRIERDSVVSGTGTLLSRSEVLIAANNLSRTETNDVDGDGTTDFNQSATTSRNAAGDTTVVETSSARNATVFSRTTTTTSQNGLTKTILMDLNGDGTTDREMTDVTVIATDQSKTRTKQTRSTSGALLSHSVEQRAADGLVGSLSTDANGDGANDLVVAVTKNASGVVTETSTATSADGSLVSRSIKTTSADGLTTTTQLDRYGRNQVDQVVVDATRKSADGSSTRTIETKSEDQALVTREVQVTSADGLAVTQTSDINGDGFIDTVQRNTRTLNADGSQLIVAEDLSGDSAILSRETTTISSDRRTVSVAGDTDGNGQTDWSEVMTIGVDGAKTVDTRELANSGVLLNRVLTTTSANGLTINQTVDEDGDGDVDIVKVVATSLPTDGRTIKVATTSAQNGALLRREISTVSANGMSVVTEADDNGDGIVDAATTTSKSIDADGSTVTVETRKAGSTTVGVTTVRASANALTTSQAQDLDGNGSIDLKQQSSRTLAADGSVTDITEKRNANDVLIARSVKTSSANGMSVVSLIDENGDGPNDRRIEETLSASGIKTSVVTELGTSNAILSKATTTTDRSGLNMSQAFDRNGDGTVDLTRTTATTIAANGSKTTVFSELQGTSTLTERSTTTESANGLNKTVVVTDANGATLRRVEETSEVFQNGATRSTTQINKGDGSLESKTVTEVSGNKRSSTITKDINGDGVADQRVTTSLADSGVSTQIWTDFKQDGVTAAKRSTLEISANGLVKTWSYDADGNGAAEKQLTETTVLGPDGRMTQTKDYRELVGGTWTLKGKAEVVQSGDELTRTSRFNDTGTGEYTITRTEITQLEADGSTSTVDTWRSGTQKTRLTETISSANGLSKTTRVDTDGNGTFDFTRTDVTALNADGSTTRTVTTKNGAGSTISTAIETISADGRTKTLSDVSSIPGVAATTTDVKTRTLADGSSLEVMTLKGSSGQLLERVEKVVSADGRRISTTSDTNGDGITNQRQEIVRTLDGRTLTTTTNFAANGTVSSKTIVALSADQLTKTTDIDWEGNGSIDVRRVQKSSFFADGSEESVTTETDLTLNKVTSVTKSRRSADGMIFSEETDLNGDGVADQVVTEVASASGARITRITNNANARADSEKRDGEIYWNGSIPTVTETVTDASGMTKRVRIDQDGDGHFEVAMVTTDLPDGSEFTEITETNTNGTIKSKGTYRTSHDGRTTVLERDGNNDGFAEFREVLIKHSTGEVTKTATTTSQTTGITQVQVTEVNALGKLANQTVTGKAGSQTYTWSNSSGTTILEEQGAAADVDVLQLDRASSSYKFTREGSDLVIVRGLAKLVLKNHFVSNASGIEQISFNNGSEVWNRTRIEAEGWYRGTDAADTIEVVAGDNKLDGGKGADTYRWGTGYGNDLIAEASSNPGDLDKLVLVGLLPSDVTVSRAGDDLVVKINGTGETLRVQGQFSLVPKGVELVSFADGTAWDIPAIYANAWIRGGDGNDTLTQDFYSQTMDGGIGSDIYYLVGPWQGTIAERGAASDVDEVRFAKSSSLWFSRSGNDLFVQSNSLRIDGTDGLVVKDHFLSNPTGIETIRFVDEGLTWDRAKIEAEAWYRGTSGNDVMEVQAGNNKLAGGLGADEYRWGVGYGNDEILDQGTAGQADKIRLINVNPEQISAERNGYDLILKIKSTGETLTVRRHFTSPTYAMEEIIFANGSAWDASAISANAWMLGGTGNDTLVADDGHPIAGGAGSDIYDLTSGRSTLIVENGAAQDVDELRLNSANGLWFSRSGNDLIVHSALDIASTNGTVVKDHFLSQETGLERVRFMRDNISWNRDRIAAESWLRGTSGADTFEAVAGASRLAGGDGSDKYRWGSGYGNDTILDNGNAGDLDQVVLTNLNVADVTVSRSDRNLVIKANATGELLTIQDHFTNGAIEQIVFANGTIWGAAEITSAGWIRGTNGADTIATTAANLTLAGGFGGDTYRIESLSHGGTVIQENGTETDNDKLVLNRAAATASLTREGDDLIVSGTRIVNHFLSRATGIEQVVGTDGVTLTRQAIDAAVWYRGTDLSDVLEQRQGDQRLAGGRGNDIYRWGTGYGNDLILDEGEADDLELVNLVASEVTLSRVANDLVVTANATGETVTVQNHFLGTSGTYSIEQLKFADGEILTRDDIRAQAWMRGTSGNDTLTPTDGDLTVSGGSGSDVYVIAQYTGQVINDRGTSTDVDVIRLASAYTSYGLTRVGNDLLIGSANGTNPFLTVKDQFVSNAEGVEQINFVNGNVTWNRAQIEAEAWYRGTTGADTMEVVAGSNKISGGAGSDTYRWGANHGDDVILDAGSAGDVDKLVLVDLLPSDVTVSRAGYDLIIKANSTGALLTIQNHFSPITSINNAIEQILFADNSTWNVAEIAAKAWIRGTTGSDTLTTSAANQTMSGGEGSDTYTIGTSTGMGTAITIEERGLASDADILRLTGSAASYAFTRAGNDLLVSFTSGTQLSLTVKDQFVSTFEGVEQISFTSGGATWNRTQIEAEAWYRGTAGADTMEVIAGSNKISGGAGSDTYRWGANHGSDVILDAGTSGDIDKLVLVDLLPSDVTVSRSGYDLTIKANSTGALLTVQDHFKPITVNSAIEQFVFADYSTWNLAEINANAWIRGTTGSDTLTSSAANQTMSGGAGSDTYVIGTSTGMGTAIVIDDRGLASDTDILRLGSATSYAFTRSGNDLLVGYTSGDQLSLTVKDQFVSTVGGMEQINFTSGGVIWNRAQIEAEAWYRGTTGVNTMEVIAGSNKISGGAGSDTYRWGANHGDDLILEAGVAGDVDKLVLVDLLPSDVTVSRVGYDLTIKANSTGALLTIQDHFKPITVNNAIEQFVFADNSIWGMDEIAANAWIRGTTSSDTLTSSAANQTMSGGAGSDTYAIGTSTGMGTAIVIEERGLASDTDILRLGSAASYAFTRSGNDLLVSFTSGTQLSLTVKDQFVSNADGVEQINFNSGALTWNRAQIEAEAFYRGSAGADTMEVVAGSNKISGGAGSDTYRWGINHGNDLILDGGAAGDFDKMVFVDLLPGDVTISRNGFDLNVRANSNGALLTIQDHFKAGTINNAIEQFVFADNSTWSSSDIAANAWIRGTSAANTLTGTTGADTLFGAGAKDTLTGGSGVDRFVIALDGMGDTITDFAPTLGEMVLFDAASFGLSKSAPMSDYLVMGTVAPNSSHGYFLASTTGVSWDPDGNGGQAATSVVVFQKAATGLSSANFAFT